MTNKQLLQVIETIDQKFETMTEEQFNDYCFGSGLLTVLEDAINEVLWSDDKIDAFWKSYQSETYDGTPKEAAICYRILEKYWEKAVDVVLWKNRENN